MFFCQFLKGDSFYDFLFCSFNPITLRKAKIICKFGLSECNRVNNETLSERCLKKANSFSYKNCPPLRKGIKKMVDLLPLKVYPFTCKHVC